MKVKPERITVYFPNGVRIVATRRARKTDKKLSKRQQYRQTLGKRLFAFLDGLGHEMLQTG